MRARNIILALRSGGTVLAVASIAAPAASVRRALSGLGGDET